MPNNRDKCGPGNDPEKDHSTCRRSERGRFSGVPFRIAQPHQHRIFTLEHKFEIGQGLNFTPRRTTYGLSRSACEVLRLLPKEGDEPQYRIKCSNENFERVVRESELD
jgi:hypothetical protein